MASDQSVETYAMCNCGQLSNNLEECERCGSKLTEALYCYGADPPAKRSRLDDRKDEAVSERTAENASNKNSSEPVPQALFAAAAAEPVSGAQPVPVPQALYVNKINNKEVSSSPFNNSQPSTPPVSIARSSPASTTGSSSIPAQPQQVYMNIQNCQFSKLSGTCGALVQPVSQPVMSNSASTTPTLAGVSQASRTTTSVNNNANYTSNFQPNVMTVPPATPLNGGGIDTSAAVTRVMTNGPNVRNQNGAVDKQPQESIVHFNAFQVRLGRMKFIPSVPIEVKSTGILMALQGDVKAPVLINARAITMCKVSWSSSFPVIFVYLEGSCIRQLRNIFSINIQDFNPEGSKDIHRRITIFPNFATTAASLSSIKNMFSSMQESDGTTNYRLVVTEINEEQAIDVLLDNVPQKIPRHPSKASTPSNNSPKPDAVSTTSQRSVPSTKPTSHPTQARLGRPPLTANPTPPTMAAASMPAPIPPNITLTTPQQGLVTGHQVQQQMQISRPPVMSTMTQQQQLSMMAQRHPPPGYHTVNRPTLPRMDIPRSRYPNQQSVVPPNTVAPNNKFPPRIPLGPGQHPSVVLPTNPQGWDHLRRTLSSGSIYQVQEANQPPQFCIWSGTEFVKCLVKETEVVLESTRISIGTLAGTPRQQIRVHGGGVYISLQINDGRNFQLHIPMEDIQPSYMCVHKKCPSIFLYTTSSGSEKVRKTLNMPAFPNSSMAKYYNPSSSDEKYKHIIIMLKAVTADQKEALSKMKLPSNNQPVIKEIHYMAAIDIINKINESTERGKNRPVQVNQGHESDDDDVIMLAEEVGIKCPITLTIMKHPVKNTVCNHSYEKQAIFEHIENKKGSARCPCAGCGNRVPIKREDLVDNMELKKYIENMDKKS